MAETCRAAQRRFDRLIAALKTLFLAGLITERERRSIERRLIARAKALGFDVEVTR